MLPMDALCSDANGSSPFLPPINANTTLWETLTPCLVHSIAPSVVALASTITLLGGLLNACIQKAETPIRFGQKLTRLKLFLYGVSLLITVTFTAVELAFSPIDGRYQREYWVHVAADLTFNVCTLAAYLICLRRGRITSSLLHFTWTLRSVALLLFELNVVGDVFVNGQHNIAYGFTLVVVSVQFLCSLALTILLWFPDERNDRYERLDEQPPCPSSTNSAAQRAFFSYIAGLMRKSYRETVTYKDFWQMEKSDRIGTIRQKLPTHYPSTRFGLLRIMYRSSWRNLVGSFLYGVLMNVFQFTNTFSIILILEVAGGDYPLWMALLIGIVPVLTEIIRIVCRQRYFIYGRLSYQNIAAAYYMMIFDKMFRLSSRSQTQTPVGHIMNYVTVDLQRMRMGWAYMKDYVICPATILVAMAILSSQVGIRGTLYGTAILFGFMIINVFTSRYAMGFYRAQMKYKDERLKLLNDVLNGIRVLKLYGWEVPIQRMVSAIRDKETNEMRKAIYFNSFIDGSFEVGPVLATIASFYGFVIQDGGQLTPKAAFLTLFLYDSVRIAVNFLPQLFTCTITGLISLKRLLGFLMLEERPPTSAPIGNRVSSEEDEDTVALIHRASYSWSGEPDEVSLRDVSLRVRRGQLVGIVGSVGAGKSTMLQALVGELLPLAGEGGEYRLTAERLAYVPQGAWIQNMTLRENILFDSELDPAFYERVLDACALRPDIEMLAAGDATEIGEKGVNLSGGQKARVSLARAVYHRSDFYALDDPFSAVDSHVAEHLFSEVVGPNGILKEATRVVALNSTKFLPQFDWIVCLKEGRVTHAGTYADLLLDVSSPISASLTLSESATTFEKTSSAGSLQKASPNEDVERRRREKDQLVREENLSYGLVSRRAYLDYLSTYGFWNIAVVTPLLILLITALISASNIYLAQWSSEVQSGSANASATETLRDLEIYGALGIIGSVLYSVVFVLLGFGSYRASRVFHARVIHSVVRAPMSFFDRTPIGRIMNRFSTDMESLDSNLSTVVIVCFISGTAVIYSFVSVFYSIPWLIPLLIPIVACIMLMMRFFNAASAQFKRMSTSAISGVCSTIQDAYLGVASIRCYGSIERFKDQLARRADRVTECNFVEQTVSAWIRTTLCLVSNLVMLIFITVGIWLAKAGLVSLGLLALIVTCSFKLNNIFGWLVEQYRTAETEIVCVERLKEYIALENEGVWQSSGKSAALRAAPNGQIEFRNVSLRYRDEDEPVLKRLSFLVESGQKVGIIGRTGAGKTSITSVLFRLVDPYEGEVLIGGANVRDYGVNLRRVLTIIPQDPVLFCGTLRANLDPFDEYKDAQVWDALEKANLLDFVQGLTNGLEHEIADSGSNLSVGQRQLVCLARALLRASTILVMDEATASVDHHTDQLIQRTIRANFSHCTILTIAHRLETIMDYDRVLVMEGGELKEFDTIANLLADEQGLFHGFAKRSGLC